MDTCSCPFAHQEAIRRLCGVQAGKMRINKENFSKRSDQPVKKKNMAMFCFDTSQTTVFLVSFLSDFY